MTFLTIIAAHAAAARFDAEYGCGCYRYRFNSVPRGFEVAVYSLTSGTFLTYV
ncbi:hypothetical protein [Methylobacterium sp. E-045]|uniref:hypothetical protein n=1 Tax=Methylobacterium sp. E-045 TaxID=2836575 RepID=UPI001FBB340A|nr:hypothetical protein [Methylobacterium sp. E-045]MCJ2131587.1 hypothetical protein [Methylobacterium sp. E-045]